MKKDLRDANVSTEENDSDKTQNEEVEENEVGRS